MRRRSSVERLRFTTSVCPSVCGWAAEENLSLIPSFAINIFQRYLVNLTSRSDTMVCGRPCSRTISLKNKVAMCEASFVLEHGIKCAILEKRSTTTNMESCPFLDLGSPSTKSMLISDHGAIGIGKGV